MKKIKGRIQHESYLTEGLLTDSDTMNEYVIGTLKFYIDEKL